MSARYRITIGFEFGDDDDGLDLLCRLAANHMVAELERWCSDLNVMPNDYTILVEELEPKQEEKTK